MNWSAGRGGRRRGAGEEGGRCAVVLGGFLSLASSVPQAAAPPTSLALGILRHTYNKLFSLGKKNQTLEKVESLKCQICVSLWVCLVWVVTPYNRHDGF